MIINDNLNFLIEKERKFIGLTWPNSTINEKHTCFQFILKKAKNFQFNNENQIFYFPTFFFFSH